jgi:hypothetical protein
LLGCFTICVIFSSSDRIFHASSRILLRSPMCGVAWPQTSGDWKQKSISIVGFLFSMSNSWSQSCIFSSCLGRSLCGAKRTIRPLHANARGKNIRALNVSEEKCGSTPSRISTKCGKADIFDWTT